MYSKPILAATDLSAQGDRAVEHAALLARQHKTDLHLLHVLPTLSWKAFGKALVEHPLVTEKQLYDAARARLQSLAEKCVQLQGISVKSHVEIGQTPERIADYVRAHGIGLTVMGPHAGGLMRDLFVGATALKTLRQVAQPALVSMSGMTGEYRRVLVAVDLSDASRAALEFAAQFVPDTPLHVLHVYDVPYQGMMHYAGVESRVIDHYRKAASDEALRALTEFLATVREPDRMVPAVECGAPARSILDQAETISADLIVMGKQGRSELDEVFLGSVTEEVLYRLDRDLLLVSGRHVPPFSSNEESRA